MEPNINGTNAASNDKVNVTDTPQLPLLLTLFERSVLRQLVNYLYPMISVWIFIVNSLTLIVYAKYKQLQKKRNVMIISLCAVDLFTGMTQYMPKLIGRLVGADNSFTICITASAVQIAPPWASIFHMVSIAIERHIAITKPLLYHAIVTPTRLALALVGVYGAAFFFALIPLAWPKDDFPKLCLSILWYPELYRYLFLIIPMAAALLIMFLLYLHIFTIARKQEIAIATADINTSGQEATKSHKESRATQVFILICGITLACYVPFWTSMTLLNAMPNNGVVIYLYYISVLCLYANSGMNFVVYAIRNSEFRARIKLLFGLKNAVQNEAITTIQD